MDRNHARLIEGEAAEALLDRGVSVPVLLFRLPWSRRALTLRLTMRRPTLGALIRIARIHGRLGASAGDIGQYDRAAQMRFMARHGRDIARIIAVTFCRGRLAARWLEGPLAWLVLHRMRPEHMAGAMDRFVSLLGTAPFLPIIRSAERANPMKPRLSRDATGS